MKEADISGMVDLQFALLGNNVPLDYADPLWQAISCRLPWLNEEALAGIHPLYGLSPGAEAWYLSRRSHLNLRLPPERVPDAQALVGARLDLAGISIEIGKMTEKAIVYTPVLYSKFVAFDAAATGLPDEAWFYAACQEGLNTLDLKPRSVLCGKRQTSRTGDRVLHGFSLMVNGLDEAATLHLMKHGLGIERKRGCGIFIPHKSSLADGS